MIAEKIRDPETIKCVGKIWLAAEYSVEFYEVLAYNNYNIISCGGVKNAKY